MSAGNIGFWLDQPAEDPPPPREHMRWTWRPQRGHPATSNPARPPRNGLPAPRPGLYANLGGPDDPDWMALQGAVAAAEPPAVAGPATGTPRRSAPGWRTRRAEWAERILGAPRPLALCGGCDFQLGSAGCVMTCGPDGMDTDGRWWP